MKYPKYSAYKHSNDEWLGEVPAHWEVRPIKRLVKVHLSNVDKHTIEAQQPVQLCNYTDVYKNEYITADMPFMPASASDEQVARLSLRKGDVIITKDSESPDDIGVSSCVTDELNGVVCGYHLAMMRPLRGIAEGAYLNRALQSAFARAQFSSLAVGMTRFGLGKYEIENALLPAPPPDEQALIATFLDRETAQIDTLISKQQKLIALLQERRYAIISHSVTKGINPSVPMKDSGIGWLGKIPRHWKIAQLRHVGSALIGLTYDPAEVVEEGDGIVVLRSSNVQGGRIVFDDNVYVKKEIPKDLVTQVGDILICSRNGSRALIGKNARIDSLSSGLTFGAFMTVFRSPASNFLYYVFNSDLFEFQSGAFLTSTINQLTIGTLKSIKVPVPPTDEQDAIVTFLDQECANLDVLLEKTTRAIALLQERRSVLISAAVTGKIDVRGLAN